MGKIIPARRADHLQQQLKNTISLTTQESVHAMHGIPVNARRLRGTVMSRHTSQRASCTYCFHFSIVLVVLLCSKQHVILSVTWRPMDYIKPKACSVYATMQTSLSQLGQRKRQRLATQV